MKSSLICLLSVCSFLSASAQAWELRNVIQATKQDFNDNLGWSVDISENFALVGAYQDHDDANESPSNNYGAAYFLWRYPDNSWNIIQKVVPSDASAADFGYSVALNENYAVIGATRGPSSFMAAGAAFVYERNSNGQWQEVKKLVPSDQADFQQFGYSVAISGNTIIVGAPRSGWTGAMYVFERTAGGDWIEKQKLTTSDAQQDDNVGYDVAIRDDLIVAGAPGERDDAPIGYGHGSVYFFRKDETGTWNEAQKVTTPDRKAGASFGWSLDLDDGQLIVGAKNEDHYGAVYFFNLESGQWAFLQRVDSPDINSFGYSVAISGNKGIVGYGDHSSANTAHVYEKTSAGDWEHSVKLYSPAYDVNSYDKFGNNVALHNDYAIIGGPGADQAGYPNYSPVSAGAAYVYYSTGKPLPFVKTDWLSATAKGYFPTLVDYDNDGDLDCFFNYFDSNNDIRETRLYKYEGGHYYLLQQRFPHLEYNSAVSWIDVNNDGWLDLILRYEENFEPKTEVYFNNHDDTFTVKLISTDVMDNIWEGDFHFADYDNDTDQDLLVRLTAEPGEKHKMKLLKNNGSFVFTDSGLAFDGVVKSTNPWYDYNNDGYKDFMAVQSVTCDRYNLVIFQNQQGTGFHRITTSLPVVNDWDLWSQSGEMQWMDYDADGDADIIWTGGDGCSTGEGNSNVYINEGHFFRNNATPFRTLLSSISLNTVDFDNNGRLDMLMHGDPEEGKREMQFLMWPLYSRLKVYEMPQYMQFGRTDIGDIEGDGDVDVLVTSNSGVQVYRNNATEGWQRQNQPPGTPQPVLGYAGNTVRVSWTATYDDTTPAPALTYNVILIRNDTVLTQTFSNLSGTRQRFVAGNAGHTLSRTFVGLKNGNYKVAVQSIDNNFQGSPFSTFIEFSISDNQTFAFASSEGDVVQDGTVDKSGNAYFTGVNCCDAGGIFINKYDTQNKLVWVKSFAGTDAKAVAIRTDANNNIFLAGYADNGFVLDGAYVSGGEFGLAAFLIKFNANGQLLWSKSFDSGNAWVSGMDIGPDNSIYLSGNFPDSPELSEMPNYILKYNNSDGTIISRTSLAGSVVLNDIRVNTEGVFVVGSRLKDEVIPEGILSKVNFDGIMEWTEIPFPGEASDATTLASDANHDIYVVGYKGQKYITKYKKDGKKLFSTFIDGFEYLYTSPVGAFQRRHWGVTTRGNDLYFIGGLEGSFEIGPVSFSSETRDVVIIKFNDIGYPQWLVRLPGDGADFARTIFTRGNDVFIGGSFGGTELLLDGYTLTKMDNGSENSFMASFTDDAVNICPPLKSQVLTDKTEVCEDRGVVLTVTPMDYARELSWYKDLSEIEDTDAFQLDAVLAGNYHAVVNPGASCTFATAPIQLAPQASATTDTDVVLVPLPAAEIQGLDAVCQNTTHHYTTAMASTNTYTWGNLVGGDLINTSQNETDVTWTTEGQGRIGVKVVNTTTGCENTNSLDVTVLSAPPKPTFTQSGNDVSAPESFAYQWYFDDEPIAESMGGRSQVLNIDATGVYSVEVFTSNMCSIKSDGVQVVFTGIEDALAAGMRVYPQPVSTTLTIELPSKRAQVHITDTYGRHVGQYIVSGQQSIDVSALPPGLYVINVQSGSAYYRRKFVKL